MTQGTRKPLDRLLPPTLSTSSEVRLPEMALGCLVAPFCAMVANAVFGSYLNRYYVDVLGWTRFGAFATLLPMVSSVLVVAANLLVGTLIDRTRTSAGKARPYLLASAPLVGVAHRAFAHDAAGGLSRPPDGLHRP